MVKEATVKRSARVTRQRILDAAVLRFSRHSYEETTLRDIATDVGVDVALVRRAFGSKEELFEQAVKSTIDGDFQQAAQAPDPGLAMTSHFVQSRLSPASGRADPLNILVHSLNSHRASPILRELVQQDFIQPLAARLPEGELGAALAIACLAGVALLRDVLGIAALRVADDEEIRPMVTKLMRACLGPNAEPDAHGVRPPQ